MGLLLSILVVCVGVIEALSCYEHFQYGVLHCATNVYERARRRSSVFLKYTSRRLRLLSDESVEEEPELLPPLEQKLPEPTSSPPKAPEPAPPAPKPPARLGKEDKIKIVKTLLEKPRRPKPVRSISMPEPIFAQKDELTDIIDSLAMDTIEEVNIEVEDAELLTNEFEKLFEKYENNSTSKRSEPDEKTERTAGMLEDSAKPEENSKVEAPVITSPREPPKEPPKTAVGSPVDVKVQSPRPSRPSRSMSLDCAKSVYTELVSSYFAKTKSPAAPPKKSKSKARRIDKLDDVTVKSDTPPVELIDETFEEIYKDVCVDVDDVTDYEEIEKSVLEGEDAGVAPKIEEPAPISNEVLLKAAQQLAEIIVRNLLKEVPRSSLGKPTGFVLEIPPQRKKPGTDGRSLEGEDLRKQAKMVLEEVGNDWTDAEEQEVEEEIQKITSTMSQVGVPMELHERRDTQKGNKPEDDKTDGREADVGIGKDEAIEKDKQQSGEKVLLEVPTAFGNVEEEIQKITSMMNQISVPVTLDTNDGRNIQKDTEKQEEGEIDDVKSVEKQTPGEATEKDKLQKERREDGKIGTVADTDAERHEGMKDMKTEKDKRDEVQPKDPASFGDSVTEEIPKTKGIGHFGLPMIEHRSEGKDTQEESKPEEGKIFHTETENRIEEQVVAAQEDKQQDWGKLLSEGATDTVEEIRKILSPIIEATVQMAADSSDEKHTEEARSKQDGRVDDRVAVSSIEKSVLGQAVEKDKLQDQENVQLVHPTAVGDSVAKEIPEVISTTGLIKEPSSSGDVDIQKVVGKAEVAGINIKGETIETKLSQEDVLEKDKQDQNKAQSTDPIAFGNSAKTESILPINEAVNHLGESHDCDPEKDKICTKTVVANTHTQPGIDSDRMLPKEAASNIQDMQKQESQSIPTAVGTSVDEEQSSAPSGAIFQELLQNKTEHRAAVAGDSGKPESIESRKEERNKVTATPEKGRKLEGNTSGSTPHLQEERQIKDILKKIGIPTEIADGDFVEVELTLQGDQISAKPQDSAFTDSVNREHLETGDKQDTTTKKQFSEEVAGDSVEEEIKKIIKASKVGIEGGDGGSKAVEKQIEAIGKEEQQDRNRDGGQLEGPTAFGDSVGEIRKTISTIEHQMVGLEQGETVDDVAKLQQEGGVLREVQSEDLNSFEDVVEKVISTGLEAQKLQDEFEGTEDRMHDTKGDEGITPQQKTIKELQELEIKSENAAVGKPAGDIIPPGGVNQAEKTFKGIEREDIKNLQKLQPTAEVGKREIDSKKQQHVLQEVSKLREKVEPTEENRGAETGPPGSDKPGRNVTDSNNDATGAKPAPEAFWLIFSGEYTKAMSKDWHSGHFSCWQCDEALTGQRYVLRDDHPYCIKCYESVFANVCEECNKIIGIDSKDLSYKDKHWHEACFLCNKCRVSLVDKQFGSKADKIYCGNCYDAQFASRCDGCGEIFRAGTKKMEYKTRQWHEKCFCCCVCKTPIGTKSFIPREQEIYCATCYEEKFATRCVKCNKIITSGGVTYKNEPWHRECFTCTNCNTSLAGQRFTSRDEKPYCADCFGELFAKRCTACSRPITGIGGTRFISFEDRHWHNDCFICASCKTSLVGRGFITDGDDIICPECAKQKLM